MSEGSENSGSFKDSRRSNEEYFEDGASSKEGSFETPHVRRSTRESRAPVRYSPSANYLLLTENGELESYSEALSSKEFVQWKKAINEEMVSLEKNLTLVLVILTNRTKAPQSLIDVRVQESRIKKKLQEPSYVRALNDTSTQHKSKGFQLAGQEENLECRLKEILYGLIQASRLWYLKFDSFMQKNKVDDMLVAGSDMAEFNKPKGKLLLVFEMKDKCSEKHVLSYVLTVDVTTVEYTKNSIHLVKDLKVCSWAKLVRILISEGSLSLLKILETKSLAGMFTRIPCIESLLALRLVGAPCSVCSAVQKGTDVCGASGATPSQSRFNDSSGRANHTVQIECDRWSTTLEHVASCIVGREAYCSAGFKGRIVGCKPNPTSTDHSPPLDISKYQFENFSEFNDDSTLIDDDSFSIDDIDYVEASPPDSELVSLEVVEIVILKVGGIDIDILQTIKDDILREKLLNVNLLIAKIEALKDNPTPSSDFISSGSPTSYSDLSLTDYEAFFRDSEPDSRDFTMDVVEVIFDNLTREPRVHVPNVLPTHPTLHLDQDFILSSDSLFAYVVWIFLPFLTYPVAPQYLLSSGNEDTIFDLGISIYHSFMPGVSHRSETFMKFNVYPNHLNESPKEILSSTCSPMDQ
ncbi:hypothetical protein Tco_0842793 [Tanacetum coccineum]|uniref:Reverse transcriptase Ty1/copia-type domain-containing protein n=1 Tax=Tanacetum coccineum TaxID=301880 RepID=A0ABQ5B082_9ASTR